MYYIIIYRTFDRLGPKAVFHLETGLGYADKAEAERYKQELIQEAQHKGASIIAGNDGYTTIEGPVLFCLYGMDHSRSNGNNKYKIGIEDDTNLGALAPEKEKANIAGKIFTDGLSFESRVKNLKQQRNSKIQAEQELANKLLNNFVAEINTTEDLRTIFKLLLKYSRKNISHNLLIDAVINKIQGTPAEKEIDWYSELSDINESISSLNEDKTGVPYKGYIICYGCYSTDRWYVKDSYENFLGTKSGYSTEEEAKEYIDKIADK